MRLPRHSLACVMLRSFPASACDHFRLMATGPFWLPCDAFVVCLRGKWIVVCEIESGKESANRVRVGEWLRCMRRAPYSSRYDRQISIDTPKKSAEIRVPWSDKNYGGASSQYESFLGLS